MDLEIRKMLNRVNGSAVRLDSLQFARLWSPPISPRYAVIRMRDLVLSPPDGYIVEELSGYRVAIEIRRVHHDH